MAVLGQYHAEKWIFYNETMLASYARLCNTNLVQQCITIMNAVKPYYTGYGETLYIGYVITLLQCNLPS